MTEAVPVPDPRARMSPLSLLAGIPCAGVPFFLCLLGFGAYLRVSCIVAIPMLIGGSFILLYAARTARNLAGRLLWSDASRAPRPHALPPLLSPAPGFPVPGVDQRSRDLELFSTLEPGCRIRRPFTPATRRIYAGLMDCRPCAPKARVRPPF